MKQFITWLYVKYVVIPALEKRILEGDMGTDDVDCADCDGCKSYVYENPNERTRH